MAQAEKKRTKKWLAEPIIVSPAYTTFEITRDDIVIPEYFFMLFLSKEKDRFGAFCSDGSVRSNLDWERFVDFDIALPSIEQQHKYVNIYLALQNPTSTPTSTPTSFVHTDNKNIVRLVKALGEEQLSVKLMMERIGLKDRENFLDYSLNPSMSEGYVRMLYPNSPRHPRQKYLLTVKGIALYNKLLQNQKDVCFGQ